MNTGYGFYSYKKKLPLSMLPFIFFLGIVTFTVLAVVGLFIGIVIGAIAAGLILLRLLTPSRGKRSERLEDDGRTVVLEKGEYEVIERVKNLK
ncbi:MAG TPA: hypothetical protein VLB01_05970 [Thermodesulfobacteriota bacterium]|nr:hypothetical protein [Thermodesulfobacteriota bacterium]